MGIDPALLTGAFLVGGLHALMPSHWMPYLLLGRIRAWPLGRVLLITAAAGLVHTVVTTALGALVGAVGERLLAWTHRGEGLLGAALIAFGLYFLVRRGHHTHGERADPPAALVPLFLALFLSPCTEMIPLFLTAAAGGTSFQMGRFLTVAAIFGAVTVGGMVLMVALSILGTRRIQLHFLEHHEREVVGTLFIVLGIAALLLSGLHGR